MSTTPGILQLDLTKGPTLQLNLTKGAKFHTKLNWDSKADVDAHALQLANGKITDAGRILSTYNSQRFHPQALLPINADKSFNTIDGALRHSGDALDGTLTDVDEMITIDTSKISADVTEIPIFVTIHPSGTSKFSQVKDAMITIEDDNGNVLGQYMLTSNFGEFDAVQMGSLMVDEHGAWTYEPVGSGFQGDFNAILKNFF